MNSEIIIASRNTKAYSYRQVINADKNKILSLLCPVMEASWTPNWHPLIVFSNSGFAEKDCLFITEDKIHRSYWYITDHCLENGTVEMIKITPEVTAIRLNIRIVEIDDNSCYVDITYRLTSLGEQGDHVLLSFTQDAYTKSMQAWERAMNHYLLTNELLDEGDTF